jgi:hypothetical protein
VFLIRHFMRVCEGGYSSSMRHLPRAAIASAACCTLLTLANACAAPPVDWTAQHSTPLGSDSARVLVADGSLRPDTMLALVSRVAAPSTNICPGSLRLAAGGPTLFAAWWAPRADSSAALLSARSIDGGRHWSAAAPVDTADKGVSGCQRLAPAIAADSASGYVHLTYAMLAPEGPGLFFAHSMDDGVTFHTPVAILYGDRLGHTSVAADGDIVVVGFEDPNSPVPRVGIAISRTMGHIFEERILPLSGDVGTATRPLTAVHGRQIAVAWEQRAAVGGSAALAVRVGTLR